MPTIKPVSDLRNYNEVLRDVGPDSPVFLTLNGRGRYSVIDLCDYERLEASVALLNQLEEGRRSFSEQGGIGADDVRACVKASLDD